MFIYTPLLALYMSKKLIELVCTANYGQSPVAELVANNYLRRRNVEDYQAISSGTSVAEIQSGQLSRPLMMHSIDIAKQRGVYSASELNEIDAAIRTDDEKTLRSFYNRAARSFILEQHEHRQAALQEFSIEETVKSTQDQTIVRPDSVAIFSLALRNNEQVKVIYRGANHQPIIEVLSRYATGDQTAEIPSAFGRGKEAYFSAIAKIVADVPKALDRLLW